MIRAHLNQASILAAGRNMNINILNIVKNAYATTNKRPMKKKEFSDSVTVAFEYGKLNGLENLYHHIKGSGEIENVDDILACLHLVIIGQYNMTQKMLGSKKRIDLSYFTDLETKYQEKE